MMVMIWFHLEVCSKMFNCLAMKLSLAGGFNMFQSMASEVLAIMKATCWRNMRLYQGPTLFYNLVTPKFSQIGIDLVKPIKIEYRKLQDMGPMVLHMFMYPEVETTEMRPTIRSKKA